VEINLTGNEVASAIDTYLVAHKIHVSGPRTITVNGELCQEGRIYVDPSGFVINDGIKFDGAHGKRKRQSLCECDDTQAVETAKGVICYECEKPK